MSSCGECKYWEHPRVDFFDAVRHGDSSSNPAITSADRVEEVRALDIQYGNCLKISLPPERAFGDKNLPLAVAVDGSDYQASILTLENFGCALYEPAIEQE